MTGLCLYAVKLSQHQLCSAEASFLGECFDSVDAFDIIFNVIEVDAEFNFRTLVVHLSGSGADQRLAVEFESMLVIACKQDSVRTFHSDIHSYRTFGSQFVAVSCINLVDDKFSWERINKSASLAPPLKVFEIKGFVDLKEGLLFCLFKFILSSFIVASL